MKKMLFSILMLAFSVNANAWQPVDGTGGVTINKNLDERSKSFQVKFKNDASIKATLTPDVTGTGYKVALNRCKNVSPGANCSVTVSFDGTKSAGAASPGQLVTGSLSSVALSSFVISKTVLTGKSVSISPSAPSLTFVAGQR